MRRSRAQPASWSGPSRSTRPAATSCAQRRSAMARLNARSKDCSRAGAQPAIVSASGRSRRPVRSHRRPRRWTILRSIAVARSNSMSCSQTAQASASNATALRGGRIQGARRIDAPIHGSSRNSRRNGPRSSSTPRPKRSRASPASAASRVGRPGAHDDAVERRLRRAQDDGLAADVQQALEHAAAATGDAVHAAAGQAERRCGAHLGADLDLGSASDRGPYARDRRLR